MNNKENKGKEIFFGVVALATLIVAIIGATLAYFSITASSNEGAVNATAAVVSIAYNDGQQVTAQADQLIPADFEDVVQPVYEKYIKGKVAGDTAPEMNICLDDNLRQVCSVYRFTISSDVDREVTATLNNEENGFTYLSYAVYDVNNQKWLPLKSTSDYFLPLTTCSNNNNEGEEAVTDDDCFAMSGLQKTYNTNRAVNSIFGLTLDDSGNTVHKAIPVSGTTQAYDLVIFLDEANENQNFEQGKNYNGTIIVEVLEGGANGTISGFVDPNNQ